VRGASSQAHAANDRAVDGVDNVFFRGIVTRVRGRWGFCCLPAALLIAMFANLVSFAGTGRADPTFQEFAAGGGAPEGITASPDDNLWFTSVASPTRGVIGDGGIGGGGQGGGDSSRRGSPLISHLPAPSTAGQRLLARSEPTSSRSESELTGLARPPTWAAGRRVHFEPNSLAASAYAYEQAPKTLASRIPQQLPQQLVGTLEGEGEQLLYHEASGVQHAPRVYLILWGSNFNTTQPGTEVRAILLKLFEGLVSTSAYQGILTQYFDSTGRVAPEATVTPYTEESVSAPKSVNDGKVREEIAKAIEAKKWTSDTNAQFTVVTAPGSTYEAGFGREFCAYHEANGGVIDAVVPYQGDPPFSTNGCLKTGNPDGNPIHKTSKSASHEYAETATDPFVDTWFSSKGKEIADLCQSENDLELADGAWVQNQYDDHLNGCAHEDLKPPHVYAITESASNGSGGETILAATLNAEGEEKTSYYFEYGTNTSYGARVPASNVPLDSTHKNQQVHQTPSGLQGNTTYHDRVVATNISGTTYGKDLTFVASSNPSVTNVQPTAGTEAGGTAVTVTGTNLTGATAVKFGSTNATSFKVESGTSITATSPAGSGTVDVTVTTSKGTSATSSGDRFAYVASPTVVTEAASARAQTSATLNASVNPNGGEVSECKFEYGTTTSYGSSAPCAPAPGSGTSAVAVSASVTGLTANTSYHFRVSAKNAGGTSTGGDQTLNTLPNAPTVVTEAASALTQTSATVNASVNPNGGEVSECKFEYGTSTAYGSSAACSPAPGSGTSPVAVSASVAGMTAHTTYHFRISATNPGGTRTGSDRTFNTATPHYYNEGVLVGSVPKTDVAWGTIKLANVKGGVTGSSVTCHSASAGTLLNPEGGGAGEGLTEAFATFSCESTGTCLAGQSTAVVAEALPWHNILTEEVLGTIRQETTGVKVSIECLVGEKVESAQRFLTGTAARGLRPAIHLGTSALHPAFFEFGEGSGELESEGSGGTITRKVEGAIKILGFDAQELISTKNP
jgi:IPT/TIG domain-containing protein